MNLMKLVPESAPPFRFQTRLEQLARCNQLNSAVARINSLRTEVLNEILLPEVRAERLEYLDAMRAKINSQHRQVHQCWPFSIN